MDRAVGALVGLAVGDALGTALEFSDRDSRPPLTDMVGGGPFNLAPGQWTDDTSMALCLGESLLANGRLEQRDLMERFVRWWRHGENSVTGNCFDIGKTTSGALSRFEGTGDPVAGSADPRAAGNGSLMRLAPVALFFHRGARDAEEAARLQSVTTHAAPAAVDACALFARMLVEAIGGRRREEVLRPRRRDGDPAVAALAAGSWKDKERGDIVSSGYVVDTLEAALWAVERSRCFEEAVLLAVNLGHDADTVGAVTGQLAGALWGVQGIPERWRDRLAWREKIEGLGRALFERGQRPGIGP